MAAKPIRSAMHTVPKQILAPRHKVVKKSRSAGHDGADRGRRSSRRPAPGVPRLKALLGPLLGRRHHRPVAQVPQGEVQARQPGRVQLHHHGVRTLLRDHLAHELGVPVAHVRRTDEPQPRAGRGPKPQNRDVDGLVSSDSLRGRGHARSRRGLAGANPRREAREAAVQRGRQARQQPEVSLPPPRVPRRVRRRHRGAPRGAPRASLAPGLPRLGPEWLVGAARMPWCEALAYFGPGAGSVGKSEPT